MQAQAQGKSGQGPSRHSNAAPASPAAPFTARGRAPLPLPSCTSRDARRPTPTPSQHRTRSPQRSHLAPRLVSTARHPQHPSLPRVSPCPPARGTRNTAAAAPQKRAAPDTVVTGAGRGGGARKRAKVADFGLGPSQESEEGNEEMENQQVMLMRMINTMMAVRVRLATSQADTAWMLWRPFPLQAAHELARYKAHPSVHIRAARVQHALTWYFYGQM